MSQIEALQFMTAPSHSWLSPEVASAMADLAVPLPVGLENQTASQPYLLQAQTVLDLLAQRNPKVANDFAEQCCTYFQEARISLIWLSVDQNEVRRVTLHR
jgi:hypothetical protein